MTEFTTSSADAFTKKVALDALDSIDDTLNKIQAIADAAEARHKSMKEPDIGAIHLLQMISDLASNTADRSALYKEFDKVE